jgi:hypothetical protein
MELLFLILVHNKSQFNSGTTTTIRTIMIEEKLCTCEKFNQQND